MPYPHDPLLLTKKPSEERRLLSQQPLLAAAEPTSPPFPTHAFAVRPRTDEASLPARPVSRSQGPLLAIPATRSRSLPNHDQTPDHDPDHRWLQGTLSKHYDGHFELRFAEPTANDPWAGQVRLEDDPRWQDYADGDLVRVEGSVVSAATPAVKWGEYPRYRARSIELLRRR